MTVKEQVGTALVKPGDIEDAVDSADLVAQFLERGFERVDERQAIEARRKWLTSEKSRIRNGYTYRAEAAYADMWSRCRQAGGHRLISTEYRGYTIQCCEICGSVQDPEGSGGRSVAREMRTALHRELVKRMIVVDEAAGLLVWPTADDYVPEVKKKRGWFK